MPAPAAPSFLAEKEAVTHLAPAKTIASAGGWDNGKDLEGAVEEKAAEPQEAEGEQVQAMRRGDGYGTTY